MADSSELTRKALLAATARERDEAIAVRDAAIAKVEQLKGKLALLANE